MDVFALDKTKSKYICIFHDLCVYSTTFYSYIFIKYSQVLNNTDISCLMILIYEIVTALKSRSGIGLTLVELYIFDVAQNTNSPSH